MALVDVKERLGRTENQFVRVGKNCIFDEEGYGYGEDISIVAEYVVGNIWDNAELLTDPALIGEDGEAEGE